VRQSIHPLDFILLSYLCLIKPCRGTQLQVICGATGEATGDAVARMKRAGLIDWCRLNRHWYPTDRGRALFANRREALHILNE
jgi:hypothetical protein